MRIEKQSTPEAVLEEDPAVPAQQRDLVVFSGQNRLAHVTFGIEDADDPGLHENTFLG